MKYSRNIKIILVSAAMLTTIAVNGIAQGTDFNITVDTNKITLWDTVRLTMTLTGGPKLKDDFEFPEIRGFTSKHSGQSSNMTIVNGAYSSSTSYTYILYPVEEGNFVIPAISLDMGGGVITSDPIEIKVVQDTGQGSDAKHSNSSQRLEDKIFLSMESSKEDIYLHEKFMVTINLYSSQISLGDIQFPVFNEQSLVTGDYETRQYRKILGGIERDVVEFKVEAYPTQTGKLQLGSASLGCNVLYRQSRGRSSSRGGFFSDDFFNSFFDRVERRPIQIKSADELSIDIKPLPALADGKVFSGGVGNFSFEMSVNPHEVKVGDPITIKMNATGTGSLDVVELPSFSDSEDFKVYEPKVQETRKSKKLEQVLIPLHEGVKELPEVDFVYFSPSSNKYETIAKGPTPIKVLESDGENELKIFDVSSPGNFIGIKERIGRDIVYIKDLPGEMHAKGKWFYNSFGLKIWVALITIIYGLLIVFYLHFKKVRSDIAYARNFNAAKKAKEKLKGAKKLIASGDINAFFEAISKIMREYVGDKFHVPGIGLTTRDLNGICEERNVSSQIINQLTSLFEKCDQIKFASGEQDIKDAKTGLSACESIINYCERNIK